MNLDSDDEDCLISVCLSELDCLKEDLQRREEEEKENRVEAVEKKVSVVEELKEEMQRLEARRGRKQQQEAGGDREFEAVERLKEENEDNTQVRLSEQRVCVCVCHSLTFDLWTVCNKADVSSDLCCCSVCRVVFIQKRKFIFLLSSPTWLAERKPPKPPGGRGRAGRWRCVIKGTVHWF